MNIINHNHLKTILKMLRLVVIFSMVLVVIVSDVSYAVDAADPNNAPAAKPADEEDDEPFMAANDILYFTHCANTFTKSGATAPSDGSGAGSDCEGKPLPDSIPEYWRTLIDETAKQYPDVDRRTVAAELWVENRGWPDPNKEWAVSESAAKGPWQFIPSTWESMQTDGDGDGIADINNPKDEVHAAFKHNKGTACKPLLEGATGDAQADYDNVPFMRDGTNTLMSSIANYNGSGAPDGVPIGKSPNGQNADYTKMAYWLIATDFKQSVNPETGEKIDANGNNGAGVDSASGGTSPAGAPDTASTDGCAKTTTSVTGDPSEPVVIDDNKYVFPIQLPKDDVTNGIGWPCSGTCHHDGSAAFDLSKNATDDSTTGTPTVAITDGTIDYIHNTYAGVAGCQEFQISGKDGYKYYYTHVQGSSLQAGQEVTAGQQVAVVGRRECTGNGSYPHLHIDRGAKGTAGGSVGNRDAGFVPLINKLYEAL